MQSNRMTLIVAYLVLVLLSVPTLSSADDAADKTESHSLWIGGHYTDYSDYTKKVGEYNIGEEDGFPSFDFNYLSLKPGSIFNLNANFYDKYNASGRVKALVGDRFKADVKYRTLFKRRGQDLLENLAAREALGWTDNPATPDPNDSMQVPGGKMMTHDLADAGADYDVKRREIMSKISYLLSKENDVRLIAQHRSIMKEGHKQGLSMSHCFSCHVVSETVPVEERTHQVQVGLEASAAQFDFGYMFGYRLFESTASVPYGTWDQAKHPVNGGAVAEFGSRLIYNDVTQPSQQLPKTEKLSHKVKVNGDVGKSRVAGTVAYSKSTNKNTDLSADVWSGAALFSTPINEKSRLITRIQGFRMQSDDVFIDLPTFRDGAADSNYMDFDFMRYSSLDRVEGKISAEFLTRMNPKTLLSVMAGYKHVGRDDYPIYDDGTTTSQFFGQVKVNYRKGMNYTTRLKYRVEFTSDPFVSGRGLFEERGNGNPLLDPVVGTSSWVFYWQREWLRYQNITNQPTIEHQFAWRNTYRAGQRYSVNFGVKGSLDKNNDLDSLDVQHFSLAPNVSLNYTPDPTTMLTVGYTYNFDKAKLPVTIAMFDG